MTGFDAAADSTTANKRFASATRPLPIPLQISSVPLPSRVSFLSSRKIQGPVRRLPALTKRRSRIASVVAGGLRLS